MATTVWRGFITFGLISIPVRLFRAARPERVSLRRVVRVDRAPEPEEDTSAEHEQDGRHSMPAPAATPKSGPAAKPLPTAEPVMAEPEFEPVRHAAVARESQTIVPEASVTKGFEFERNRYVAIDREELKSITAKTSSEMEILEFVKLVEIDPVYFETSYYVRPEESGERAYALLYKALQKTGLVAIGQFAMHGREHVFVIRPGSRGVIAHTLFYATEVRAAEEYRAQTETIKPNELQLSEQLIHSLQASFEPEKYKDTYRERLEALIAAKAEGRAAPAPMPEPQRKQVVDITEALKQSLAQLKKPPAREAPRTRSASKKAAGSGSARR
jgi:DNA end-binding protein Ku